MANAAQFEAFYDTETTGPEPVFDQVLQLAAILTDDDFVEIDSFDERSRMSPHMVPTPGALKVTHLNPYDIARAPRSSYEFARHMHATFQSWADKGRLDVSGWNTLQYDEEIMRRMFWLNLLDPYVSSGKGKRRVDYLTMTRALAARNPDILVIPIREETGKPNFKLENIATANGFSDHNAHDALGDVRATIHMARLIRDLDPSLFDHAKAMGAASEAVDFVDGERVFRMVGGAMVTPGILDVCLLATDPDNPKAKTAWNLAVDPEPFFAMTAEEILVAMKKTGTPFRSVKCHKSPLVFPTTWEFLRHASGTDAPTPDLIDARSKAVMENEDFRTKVIQALRLKAASYAPNEHLEQKIYDGFPTWDDKNKMKAFHNASNWTRRLEIARSFEKTELQQIGLRLVWANAPEVLDERLRDGISARIAETRFGLLTGQPWTTVGSFMEELDDWDAKLPDDPELAVIRTWILETYPEAKNWVPVAQRKAEQETPATEADANKAPTTAAPPPHFLDGID